MKRWGTGEKKFEVKTEINILIFPLKVKQKSKKKTNFYFPVFYGATQKKSTIIYKIKNLLSFNSDHFILLTFY